LFASLRRAFTRAAVSAAAAVFAFAVAVASVVVMGFSQLGDQLFNRLFRHKTLPSEVRLRFKLVI
jgi:hypothetical protein